MQLGYLYLVPIFQLVIFGLGIPIIYISAIHNGNLYPVLPYISDTGARLPEYGFFAELAVLEAVFLLILLPLRYLLVEHVCTTYQLSPRIVKWNRYSVYAGLIGILALTVTGCFSIRYTPICHLIGSGTCITCGTLHNLIQTWISFKLHPIIGNWKMNIVRFITAIITVVSFCFCLVFFLISTLDLDVNFLEYDFAQWSPEIKNYKYHLVSTTSEWITIYSLMLFWSTYSLEYRYISNIEGNIKVRTKNDDLEYPV